MFFNSKITLHEVYFGKTPELYKIEKQLGIFRQKYLGRYLTNIHCNSDPDLLKFNRMMEDYFGFGCYSLNIVNQPIENAYTIPLDIRYDVINSNKHLVADKKGFKFNKDANYACMVYIYTGIIFNPEYTDEEVMAIIMHEVGHNFYAALDRKHGILSNLFSVLVFLVAILNIILKLLGRKNDVSNIYDISLGNFNSVRKIQLEISKYMRENNNIIIIVYDWFIAFGKIAETLKYGFYNIIDLATLGFLNLIYNIKSVPFQILNPIQYLLWLRDIPNEKLADNFATMYGYGPALSSGLEKFDSYDMKGSPSKINDVYAKIPFISNIHAINTSIGTIILQAFDEHPSCIARTKDQLDMLEREAMKEDLDPKVKKVILADCKACKAQINKLIDTSKGISDKNIVRAIYYKSLYENSNCKELKDLIYDEVNKFDVYDRTYEEKLKK